MKTGKYLFDLVCVALLKITLTTNVPKNCLNFIPPVSVHAGMIIQHVFTTEKNPGIIVWEHTRV